MTSAASRRSSCRLAACLLVAAGAAATTSAQTGEGNEVKGRLLVTRQDLAELVQIVDELYAAGNRVPATGELSAEAATQMAFDELSMDFLRFRISTAFGKLDGLRQALGGQAPHAGNELRLELHVEDRWVRHGTFTRGSAPADSMHEFRLRSVRPLDAWTSQGVRFEFWEGPASFKGASFEFRTDERGAVEPATFRALFNPLQVARRSAPTIVFRRLFETPGLWIEYTEEERAPDAMRADWLARAAALTDVGLDAVRVFVSRANLRWEAPSQERSSEFLTNGIHHARAVEGELRSLEAGEDPYRRRLGDHWRTHAHGKRDLPLRVYAPNTLGKTKVPMVVAFHGAGGDESFFFELAGDGRIKDLARSHGCLVVAPFTPNYLASPAAFDALVEAMAADYPIDREQIYVIGHSLGAMTTSRLIAERGDRIRAAACVAGFRAVTKEAPPVLVIQGGLDPIIRAERVGKSVRESKDADVNYVLLDEMGHTLLLQRAVELAFETWFE